MALGVTAFHYIGRVAGIPAIPELTGSLFQQHSPTGSMLIVSTSFVAVCALGAVVGGDSRAGLLAGGAGLVCLSLRFGTAHCAIAQGTSSAVFATLAIELALLGVTVALGMLVLRWLPHRPAAVPIAGCERPLLGIACFALVMLTLTLLLLRTEAKLQSLGAIALGAYVGARVARSTVGTPPVALLVLVPPLIGVIGYLTSFRADSTSWIIGHPGGVFAPLARALPIDYAGAGLVGIMLGLGRRSTSEAEDE